MSDTDDSGEEDSGKSSGGGFFTGLFFGLLAGAVLAVVTAPQSGEDTRDLIRAKVREAADRTRDTAGDISDGVTGTTNDLVGRGRTIVDSARARIDGAIVEGMDAAEKQRSQLEDET